MAGEVRDRQHLVAQRRHEQQVDGGEDARHLHRHLTPEAIGLHEIHGGEKPRLAEEIRPRIRRLNFKLLNLPAERQLFKRGRGLGKEN